MFGLFCESGIAPPYVCFFPREDMIWCYGSVVTWLFLGAFGQKGMIGFFAAIKSTHHCFFLFNCIIILKNVAK